MDNGNRNNGRFHKFIKIIENETINPLSKISIFGCNEVSVSIVSHFILNNIGAAICVYDESQTKLDIHMSDFKYFQMLFSNLQFSYTNDITKTFNSDICICCFEEVPFSPAKKFESCLKNIQLYEKHTPNIVKYSPNAILIVATYPYSLMTYFCLKFSKLTPNRVFGLGVAISSKIFRVLLSNYFDVSVHNIYAWMGGGNVHTTDHEYCGTEFFPLWSTVSVAGVNIQNLINMYKYEDITLETEINNLFLFIKTKVNEILDTLGRPVFICVTLFRICQSILTNSRMFFSVSYNVKGMYNIHFDSFIGLPCGIGRDGVTCNLNLKLTSNEIKLIRSAAEMVAKDIDLMEQLSTTEAKKEL